jgi:predicted MPP superfamily phosphohydrolase
VKSVRIPRPRVSRRAFLRAGFAAGAAALLASYPLVFERYWVSVNVYRIPVPRLPESLTGLRIVHLTDLHYGFLVPLAWIKRIIAWANSLAGDVIVCTGDYVHARRTREPVDAVWPHLLKLRAKHGVFNVLGNHDHWADTDRSLQWLEQSGQSVRHRARLIERDGARLWIAGAGDYWEDRSGLDEALDGIPEADCRIALAHNPDTADERRRSRVDLTISGHTHGGQVRLPILGTPLLPVKNKAYSSGLVVTDHSRVFISRGIGWALLPVRLGCPPEIAVLELEPLAH